MRSGWDGGRKSNKHHRAAFAAPAYVVVVAVVVGDGQVLAGDGEGATVAAAAAFDAHAQTGELGLCQPDVVGPELLAAEGWLHGE